MTNQEKVQRFHERYGFPIGKRLAKGSNTDVESCLYDFSQYMRMVSDRMIKDAPCDLRVARLQLMFEELGEVTQALALGDEVALADGLADLAFVVYGTAVAYDMPLDDLIHEVYASNMSKDVDGQHKPHKGATYFPPDVKGVLQRARRAR